MITIFHQSARHLSTKLKIETRILKEFSFLKHQKYKRLFRAEYLNLPGEIQGGFTVEVVPHRATWRINRTMCWAGQWAALFLSRRLAHVKVYRYKRIYTMLGTISCLVWKGWESKLSGGKLAEGQDRSQTTNDHGEDI